MLNIIRNRFYFIIFSFGFTILILIPIIVSTVIIPSFKTQVINNVVAESKRVATHLSNSIDYKNKNIDEIDMLVNQELKEFQILKIHYFDKDGKVIYSTLRDNIGTLNTRTYFHNIVKKGNIYYKIGQKGGKTSENEDIEVSLIEIYIPIMKNGKFEASFELYYDISKVENDFFTLSRDVTIINSMIALLLAIIMFVMLYNASKNNIRKEQLLKHNLKINKNLIEFQENLKDKTLELLATNGTLNSSVIQLARTQEQLIQAQEIANKARKNAEEANREKSMFLANISHELKTPLNGISGLVYLSKLRVQDKEVSKNLSSIQDYSETLLRMISDLLDSSKTDAKYLTIEKSTFNLNDMLESLKQLYKMQCSNKNIEFELHYDKDIPLNLISDPVRLHQVITNLLNNAIKFTHQGKVRLDAQIQSSNEKQIKMKFIVKDDGIGIKEEELKNIFKPFYQTKESLNYYAGGSGLGLNISQKIVEQLDGIIWADSVIDKGSSFFVLLEFDIGNNEITAIEHKNEDIKNISDNSNKKVLVVDDNNININVLSGILKSIGITCDSAINGLKALDLVKQTKYDIVLTDIKMPVMDGCELTKHIRKIYDKDELPIIAISANGLDQCGDCIHSCGINDYIQKPINPDSFLITLQKYINCNINKNQCIEEIYIQGNSVLDVPDALKRFVNNNELYTQALRSFINDYGDSVDKIKGLINSKNTNDLIDYLHTIKGISANLSAKEFSMITAKFHDNVKYGKDYRNLLNEYDSSLNELKKEIDMYLSKQEVVIEDDNLLNNKEEVLIRLLEYCKGHNTKAIHFFKEISYVLKEDPFIAEVERDIFNYNFKKAKEKIISYFEKNNNYKI